jgi:hypothetical protein
MNQGNSRKFGDSRQAVRSSHSLSPRRNELFMGAKCPSPKLKGVWDEVLSDWVDEIGSLQQENFESVEAIKERLVQLVIERNRPLADVKVNGVGFDEKSASKQLREMLDILPEFEELFANCLIAGFPCR